MRQKLLRVAGHTTSGVADYANASKFPWYVHLRREWGKLAYGGRSLHAA